MWPYSFWFWVGPVNLHNHWAMKSNEQREWLLQYRNYSYQASELMGLIK